MNCPNCQQEMDGIQYDWDHPHAYDGISEWVCPNCNLRLGRWTHDILKDGECETRHGRPRW